MLMFYFRVAQFENKENGQLYVNDTHGGCPEYKVERSDDTYTISKVSDKCKASFPVKAPISAAGIYFQ
jgi:hypothetical protein